MLKKMGHFTNIGQVARACASFRSNQRAAPAQCRRNKSMACPFLLPLLIVTLCQLVALNQGIDCKVQATNTTSQQRHSIEQHQMPGHNKQQQQHHHFRNKASLAASRDLSEPTSLSSSMLRTFIRTNNMRAYHLDLHSYRAEASYSGDPSYVDSRRAGHVQRCRRHLNYYNSLLKAYMQSDPMEMSNTLDSLRLADTYGRPDAGLLDGHQFWLGSYERCLEIKLNLDEADYYYHNDNNDASGRDNKNNKDEDYDAIDGSSSAELLTATPNLLNSQYCLGLAQFPSWKREDSKTSIKIGMCLPETCTSSMLNSHEDLFSLAEQMMKYQLGGPNQPFNKLKLRSIYCLPHESSQARKISLSGKLLVSLLSILIASCLYATLHDYLARKTSTSAATSAAIQVLAAAVARQSAPTSVASESGNGDALSEAIKSDKRETDTKTEKIENGEQREEVVVVKGELARNWRTILIESFSLIRNFEKIASIEPRPDTSSIEPYRFNRDVFFNSITGIKCIGLIWIIAAHTFLVGPITHKNLINMDNFTKTYLANIYLAAHLMVDSFFALSGLLASYLLFRSQGLATMTLKNWTVLTIHRYWRLTPLYLLCYWFAKSLGHLVNSGPLWDYSTAAQSPRLNCANETWLEAILHMSDFKSPKEHCVPFAWFIANGIKFSLITPLFLTVLYKSTKRGYALISATILANIVLVVALAINSKVDMKSVIEFKPESADNMLNNMEEIYTRPYSRIGAYLVGLLAGHVIYLVEAQQQPVNMSEKMKILVWSLFSATIIVLTFVVKIAGGVELEDSAIPWVFSLCAGLIRPLWALCTCWLVFALAHGQARWLANFLSADVWRLLIKLSFSAYLVQGEVIANLYLSYTHSSLYTYTEMVTRPIVATFITLALSFVIALVVEYPLIGIEELVLPRRKRPTGQVEKKHSDIGEPLQDQTKHSSKTTTTTTTGSVVGSINISATTRKACNFIVQSVNGSSKVEKLKEL